MTESRSLPFRPRTGTVAALLAVLAAVLAAGCGSAAPGRAGAPVGIGLREYRFTPGTVHASPGTVTLVVRNYGRLTHDLVIRSAAGVEQGATDPLAPGQATTVTLVLTRGRYALVSSVGNDKQLGLDGTLQVR